MEQNENQEVVESRVIKNLDKLGLPMRKRTLMGVTVWVRRIDDVGLKDWARIDFLQSERHAARSEKSDLVSSGAPIDIDNFMPLDGESEEDFGERIDKLLAEEKVRLGEIEEKKKDCDRREMQSIKGLLAIYIHHDGGDEGADAGLSEGFLLKAENITDAQIIALSSVFMMRPLEVGETEGEKDSTQEMSQNSSDSMVETQRDG